MKLSRRLEDDFSAAVRQRGQAYYWQRLIRIRSGDRQRVTADVTGAERYGVTLDWDDPFLTMWCDCPYFERDGPCKHLWATILAAEAQDFLADVTAAPEVIVDDDLAPEGDETAVNVDEVAAGSAAKRSDTPTWKHDITTLARGNPLAKQFSENWPAKRELVYQVDAQTSIAAANIVLAVETRDRKSDGTFKQPVHISIKRGQIPLLPPADCEIMTLLAGGLEYYGWGDPDRYAHLPPSRLLSPTLAPIILPRIIETGRCFLRKARQAAEPAPLTMDQGEAWQFELQMKPREITGWTVSGFLRRGEERLELRDTDLVTGSFVFAFNKVWRLAPGTSPEWLNHMRRTNAISVSDKDGDALLGDLLSLPGVPPVSVPDELAFEEIALTPRQILKIRAGGGGGTGTRVRAELFFDYGGITVPATEVGRGIYDGATRRFVRRSAQSEQAAGEMLKELGFRPASASEGREAGIWLTHAAKVARAVRTLIEAGWHVEAEGKIFRKPAGYRVEVASGVDWFELRGEVQYGETTASLPELLAAVRRGETAVQLGDGTFGVLPEEWLQRIGLVAGLGAAENGHIRFRANQAGLLDALLAAQPEVSCDQAFLQVREQLGSFAGIEPAAQPAGFQGVLRDYQREGLGWMEFLRALSFGGCLADDMGVGKTAQVLALLETRRELRAQGTALPPSLVVAPRSLIFNWQEEAARFTPHLRVLDYSGSERAEESFAGYDVVLTTYGTMRRDAPRLKDIQFDYLILDEAQAVKNSGTESAKAVRLLKGAHRLALSGTPVENHLGELFALFEFLNPGMLNAASVFKLAGGAMRSVSEESLKLLAQALRPFILRRTKEQVARELPAKTEQTIYCEMEPAQRKLYNDLRQHYRNTLLGKIQKEGLGKSKMQVLEALLRLRQAACHPGLIDAKRAGEPSAKLDVLLDQLREVLAEGHKALVFSQFTSLLKIVREHLDEEGVVYEYLDGKTQDRQARVERFQNDEACKLFLISLKAGGLGLNLTAAGYVFLLDPWWNPAVEAQAVDRAHRIGQTQQVFAYRLIARDTVEEKVLELQKTKRDLASALISQDNNLIKNLQREDLELLLS